MAFERQWMAVSAAFTANGTLQGFLTVADATGFYVKQLVLLTSTTKQNKLFKVQRVVGPGTIYLGFPDDPIDKYRDLSTYLVSDNATITANQQEIRPIKPEDIMNAIYAREPIVAIRTIGVDQFGTPFDNDNPLPVSFSAAFPNIVKIADGGGSGYEVAVNADGSINVHTTSGPTVPTQYINQFTAVSSVAYGASTTIGTYTVPATKTATLERVEVSGTNIAQYSVKVNGVEQARKITYFGGGLNESFNFTAPNQDGYPLNTGDVVTIVVLHLRPYVGDFQSRIQAAQLG